MSSLLNETSKLPKASLILEAPKNIVNSLYNGWSYAFDLLHNVPAERQELLNIIGTSGAELFRLNSVLTTFLMTQLSGVRSDIVESINAKLNTLPNFIFNANGTVTEVIVTPPTASTISYGQALSSSTLTGGSATIPGTFSFNTPTDKPNAGTQKVSVKFTPTDLTKFKVTYHFVDIVVTPITIPNVTFTPPASLVYDGNPKAISYTVAGPSGTSVLYSGRNGTVFSNSVVPPTDPGDYTITVTSTDSNYTGSRTYNFTIAPSS